ncbi:hypothetical protein [Nocardia anaemiae]|uniref:hypothetical protein n=1 Tax=Nocardia anaemiae TaxID=263910 RepID=UPI0007A47F3B|nr:hypothetical protein [Nocardia anaemiae]
MRERVTHRRQAPSAGARIFGLLLLLWLVIGILAAGQRRYFESGPINCAGFGTIAVTALAGPLNYMGVNPKVDECNLPQPSQ